MIRDQLGIVPPQWSVAYRFVIAAVAMALVAKWKGESMRLGGKALGAAVFLGFAQFCINFNAVYLAEQHITSGVVATVFALLLIPSTLMAWAFLGHRPSGRFVWSSLIAVLGIGLLFVHEFRQHSARADEIALGIGLTLIGMVGASAANVFQAREEVRALSAVRHARLVDGLWCGHGCVIAFAMAGPPVFDSRPGYWLGVVYLALPASVLTFSLYYPVVRKIGPAKAAYSSAIIPIIAMAFSTALEGYRWSPLAITGALLAIGGMIGALRREKEVVAPPDAA